MEFLMRICPKPDHLTIASRASRLLQHARHSPDGILRPQCRLRDPRAQRDRVLHHFQLIAVPTFERGCLILNPV